MGVRAITPVTSQELLALAERAGVGHSEARCRQLRWVAGELHRARTLPEVAAFAHPPLAGRDLLDLLGPGLLAAHQYLAGPKSVGELFSTRAATVYLDLAEAGWLRVRDLGTPTPPESTAIRIHCLGLMAEAAGVPAPRIDRPDCHRLPVVSGWQRRALLDQLETYVRQWPQDAGRWRAWALVAVVQDTGARLGALTAMETQHLDARLGELVLPAGADGASEAATAELSPASHDALSGWLGSRAELVERLQGAAPSALWVGVRPHGAEREDGAWSKRPAGLALEPHGLARAYHRAVAEANVELAGTPGWAPLPTRLEQLRRGVAEVSAQLALFT